MGKVSPGEQIGILESWDMCEDSSKWAEVFIDGERSTMKYGELSHMIYRLPGLIWRTWEAETTYDEINKAYPGWPIGHKVKHLHGKVVALWVPTKGVWIRNKY